MISTSIRKGAEVLQVAFNVRMLSNVAKRQKVPYDDLIPYLAGQRQDTEGTEIERNVCLVFCAIEEGFRLQRKPCPYTIDDIWDWFMDSSPEFINAINAIYDAIAEASTQLEAAEGSDVKKK